ncbi:hypothetical protein [Aulosira sp. FACHB-615]|uniref:hypothetical protein n=1 Tax=Aulosira sp. FACHB-615 TaxID=2692777 RepID=UPI0016892DC6|nr:hypothetical protein [Aulosira sp. FACHB-615]MBD2487203.1 hypothetical protein [Aulosira sp. FACHB-615]
MVPDTAYYFRPLSVEGWKLAIAKIYQFMMPPAMGIICKNTRLANFITSNCFEQPTMPESESPNAE